MKKKVEITKENYKEIVLKRAIIVCWVLLAICLIIKICGGNIFNIACETEAFIKFCNYCDTSFIRYVIYFAYFMFESTVYALTLKPETKITDKRFWFYFISCVIFWAIKVLYEVGIIKINIIIANIIPLIILYLLLLLFSKRPVMSILIILYQTALVLLSSYIKSISLTGTLSESALMTFIFYIDYYIVFLMTMLYSKIIYLKKEKLNNGVN